MFLYTFLKFFVSGSWQLFNMSDRFYVPVILFVWFITFGKSCSPGNILNISFECSVMIGINNGYVSGLSCRKLNLCHFSYWYDVWLVSQRYHLTLSFWFHSFHVTFIYTMNWMIFYFVWFVFLLFSFDVIIISPSSAFVNAFLYFSYNYYLFHYL